MTGRPMILWMYIRVANNIITLEGRRNGNTGIFTGSNGKGASDLFIVAGLPLTYKINRKMIRVGCCLMPEDTRKLIEDIYVIAQERKIETLEKNGDDDFSFSIPNLGRFRVSTYRQRGSLAAVIRLIAFRL